MLNCVGIFREKLQTWLGWLTISPSSDTTRRSPVSCSWPRTERSFVAPGRVSVCDDVDATQRQPTARASLGNTFFFSHQQARCQKPTRRGVGFLPYRFESLRVGSSFVVVVIFELDQVKLLSCWFKISHILSLLIQRSSAR